jgi:hypothetical protein
LSGILAQIDKRGVVDRWQTPYHRPMNLDLSDDETAEITRVLTDITGNDRYPFTERIR